MVALNGLHILATERHEARRIDNQLRGRAGRQGDPGSSRFYLSLQDDLMRIFGSDRISGIMQKLGMEEGVPIEHGMVTRAIERAQKQVEAQNFSVRKHLLEYDDVMNKQRENIYALRREVLEGKIHLEEDDVVGTREYLMALAEDLVDSIVETFAGREIEAEHGISRRCSARCRASSPSRPTTSTSAIGRPTRSATCCGERIVAQYDEKEAARRPRGAAARRARRHAADRRPAVEGSPLQPRSPEGRHRAARLRPARSAGRIQEESFELFQDMKARMDEEIVRYLWWLRPIVSDDAPVRRARPAAARPAHPERGPSEEPNPAFGGAARLRVAFGGAASNRQPPRVGGDDAAVKTVRHDEPKVGRNDPCPCGSGKKYKKCHGRGTWK